MTPTTTGHARLCRLHLRYRWGLWQPRHRRLAVQFDLQSDRSDRIAGACLTRSCGAPHGAAAACV